LIDRQGIEALFRRITEKGKGERPIRKPEILPVLVEITRLDAKRLREIVEAFAARGLLVLRESETEGFQVDLPHECLGWKWKQLEGWIEKEAALAKTLEFLKDSAQKQQWLTGSALAEAQLLLKGGRLDGLWPLRYLSETELAAVKNWIGESTKRDHDERLRLVRERRRARLTAVGIGLVALLLVGLVGWAWDQKGRADRLAQESRGNEQKALRYSKALLAQSLEAEKARERAVQAEGDAKAQGAKALQQLSVANEERHQAQIALARSFVQDGTKLFDDGRPEQALAYFARALRDAPELVAARSWISDLLLNAAWWIPGEPCSIRMRSSPRRSVPMDGEW
jgi:hypothetical protein